MSVFVQLEIVTPEAMVLAEETILVTAPGVEGYFGVMAGHVPFVTLLKAGILIVGHHTPGEKDDAKRYAIAGGYAEVLPDKVIILTEKALAREQIDAQQLQQEQQEARNKLATLGHDDDMVSYWQSRLDFATVCTELLRGPSA
ncbi:MAG: ATP synthase F1 subunit epsilon [Magnetococcus sp. YQC-5]